MLQSVDVGKHRIDAYAASAGADVIDQLRALAKSLQGVRVLHLNATPYGGGVAEILRSEIPLLRDLGLDATWKIITGGEAFFRATKAMHNGLQGSERGLTQIDRETYVANSKANAALLESEYDLYFIHDPQPLGLTEYHGRRDGKWIWRCHIDTARPNAETWAFLRPYVRHYDAAVFTLGGFVPPDIPLERVEIIPPAIDPESPKNMVLKPSTAKRMLQWIGVDPDRPLVAQVSRFDPWKDPLGAIEAYRLAREEIPGLQLAMVGSMALDDPEGCEIYEQVRAATEGDRDIGLHTNLNGVGNMEVNAFQRLADVAIQMSTREGFGLIVSETLWKDTPMVARGSGGIPLQMPGGSGGALIDTVEECAENIVQLVRHPRRARQLARAGRELVRDRFLLTRLIADELKLYASLLGRRVPRHTPVAMAALSGEERDPVSGIAIDPATSLQEVYQGRTYHFNGEGSRAQFAADPERFRRGMRKAS